MMRMTAMVAAMYLVLKSYVICFKSGTLSTPKSLKLRVQDYRTPLVNASRLTCYMHKCLTKLLMMDLRKA